MSNSLLIDSSVDCWLSGFDRLKKRLDSVLSKLQEDECNWAPDVGVATPKDHLWAIAESERNLVAFLARGKRPAIGHKAKDIEFSEIKRMLGICHGKLQDELNKLASQEISPDVTDAILIHLDHKSHHSAAIACLTQLIDPSRLPALLL